MHVILYCDLPHCPSAYPYIQHVQRVAIVAKNRTFKGGHILQRLLLYLTDTSFVFEQYVHIQSKPCMHLARGESHKILYSITSCSAHDQNIISNVPQKRPVKYSHLIFREKDAHCHCASCGVLTCSFAKRLTCAPTDSYPARTSCSAHARKIIPNVPQKHPVEYFHFIFNRKMRIAIVHSVVCLHVHLQKD